MERKEKRKGEQSRRKSLAQTMAAMGFIDSPYVRYFLRGDKVEVWRRDCRCASECNCWEFAGTQTATDQDREAFFVAQKPEAPKPAPKPLENTVAEVMRRAVAAPRWRPGLFTEEEAR